LTLLNKIPGTVLVLLGALCLSFGGIIVKSFEGANLWQILFWRQTFFSIIVALYLLITFKKNFFKSFHASGLPGLIAGIFLGIGFSAYVFAMYHTTIANTLFIISTEIFFLALFGYIFLKEKINLVTLISIIMGMSGVLLIIGSSLSIQSSSQFFGNIIGGKKLTKISPNKTISGSIGSFIFSILPIFLIDLQNYIDINFDFSLKNILFCLIISLTCQLGDLFISYFKRLNKVKNTGSILPGHGGLLDRIDGIIFAIPTASILKLSQIF